VFRGQKKTVLIRHRYLGYILNPPREGGEKAAKGETSEIVGEKNEYFEENGKGSGKKLWKTGEKNIDGPGASATRAPGEELLE